MAYSLNYAKQTKNSYQLAFEYQSNKVRFLLIIFLHIIFCKVNRLVVYVLLNSMITNFLPLTALGIASALKFNIGTEFGPVGIVFLLTNMAINPFIYGTKHGEIRTAFRHLFRRLRSSTVDKYSRTCSFAHENSEMCTKLWYRKICDINSIDDIIRIITREQVIDHNLKNVNAAALFRFMKNVKQPQFNSGDLRSRVVLSQFFQMTPLIFAADFLSCHFSLLSPYLHFRFTWLG